MQFKELADVIDPDYSAMIWLGAVLGLRWGEVAGLRVGNVDVLRKSVTIAEQVTRGRGGAGGIGPPKSAAARRTISIPNELADELSGHMKSMGLTGADPDALLFPNHDGRPLDYSNWRGRVWEPATKFVGMAGLNFHDLRRTNATRWLPKESTSRQLRPDSDTPTPGSHWRYTRRRRPKATGLRRTSSVHG